MSATEPQTPRPHLHGKPGYELVPPQRTEPCLARKCLEWDDLPELGHDETPPPCNSSPSTPQDLHSAPDFDASPTIQKSPSIRARENTKSVATVRNDQPMSQNVRDLDQTADAFDEPTDKLFPSRCRLFKGSEGVNVSLEQLPTCNVNQVDLNFSPKSTFSQPPGSRSRTTFASLLSPADVTSATEKHQPTFPEEATKEEVVKEEIVKEEVHINHLNPLQSLHGQPLETPPLSQTLNTLESFAANVSEHCSLSEHIHESTTIEKRVQGQRANTVLKIILPYDIAENLYNHPRQCVAQTTTAPYRRCKSVSKWTNADAGQLVDRLSGTSDLATAAPLIREILGKAMCKPNHHNRAQKVLDELLEIEAYANIVRRSEIAKVENPSSLLPTNLNDVPVWLSLLKESLSSLGGAGSSVKSPEALHSTTQSVSSINTSTAHGKRPEIQISYNQRFYHFHSPNADWSRSLEEALLHKICEPLNWQEEVIEGSIYVYWHQGDFGHVKIGVTTRKIDDRLQEWEKMCKCDVKQLNISDADTDGLNFVSEKIPHIYRAELLIHTELREQRRRTDCKCGRKHQEWFDVPLAMAKKVVDKWTSWMKTSRPYVVREDSVGSKLYTKTKQTQTSSGAGATAIVVASAEDQSILELKSQTGSTKKTPSKTKTINGIKMVYHEKNRKYVQAMPLSASVTNDAITEMCIPVKCSLQHQKPAHSPNRARGRLSRSPSPRRPRVRSVSPQLSLDFNKEPEFGRSSISAEDDRFLKTESITDGLVEGMS